MSIYHAQDATFYPATAVYKVDRAYSLEFSYPFVTFKAKSSKIKTWTLSCIPYLIFIAWNVTCHLYLSKVGDKKNIKL